MNITNEQLNSIIEDPKTFLLKALRAKVLINAKMERINTWRLRAKSITVTLSNGGFGSGGKKSLVENSVCSIDVLETEILEEVNDLVVYERIIHEVINTFSTDDRYKAVLELRYLNGYSWRAIGAKLNYGEDWVCRLHGFALQEIIESIKSTRIKSVDTAL